MSRPALAGVAAVALLLSACSDGGGGETFVFGPDDPELAQASVAPDGTWESAPWSGDDVRWLPFPGRVTLVLQHDLGRIPRVVLVYLSFDEQGRSAALAAGELARVQVVTETDLTLTNGTQADFFARVVLR